VPEAAPLDKPLGPAKDDEFDAGNGGMMPLVLAVKIELVVPAKVVIGAVIETAMVLEFRIDTEGCAWVPMRLGDVPVLVVPVLDGWLERVFCPLEVAVTLLWP
jgi:hypothetical protein